MVDVTLSVDDSRLIQWIQAAQNDGMNVEEWLIKHIDLNFSRQDRIDDRESTEIENRNISGLAERAWDRRSKIGENLAEQNRGDREYLRLESIRGEPVTGLNIGKLEDEMLPTGLLRLLPMKHALRLLWSMSSTIKKSLPDGEFRNALNHMLQLNGTILAAEDEKYGRGRGERLAAGFSHLDDDARIRTVNWMIGSPGGSTKLSAMEIIGWSCKDSEGYRFTPH